MPENAWGLQKLGDFAFFQNVRLDFIKLPATLAKPGSSEWGFHAFSCHNGQDDCSYASAIDLSDWVNTAKISQDPPLPAEAYAKFGWNFDNWTGKIILRWHDGVYGPKISEGEPQTNLAYLNNWQQALGCSHTSSAWSDRHTLNDNGGTIEWWGEPV